MRRIYKKIVKIERRFYLTFKQQLVWMISTAFAIAAALMWKDAIVLTLKNYLSTSTELTYSIYAAIIVTLIGVFVIWLANEIFKKR